MKKGARIHVSGIVQGVGFRPFVYHSAVKFGLRGFCLNDSEGVVIEVMGEHVDAFIREIKTNPPPLARIENLAISPIEAKEMPAYRGFEIRESIGQKGLSTLISPDVATCDDCLHELLNPSDRRYLYPFINCTNCGPRYSIIKDVPYDRPKTTMAGFRMCPRCEAEYHDAADRRFHAQPNACAECGPKVWLAGKAGGIDEAAGINHGAIKKAKALLKDGKILAIKGIGGFHLACDAENAGAVERLREKKRKSNKPFALMAPDIRTVMSFAEVSKAEESALMKWTRPIVILRKKNENALSPCVAPGNSCLGVMLPYAPLHHLLFNPDEPSFTSLVMTSGNRADEPIVTANEEALKRLGRIADFFLLHDRDIYMRLDDSIARVHGEKSVSLIRRARGVTPAPVDLKEDMPEVFAAGAHLKNTFCITKGRNAILSQHIGDLENLESLEFYRESLGNLSNTFSFAPRLIAHDMHPDYLSTRFAVEYARANNIDPAIVVPVQHHHAHIAGVLAEHGIRGKVIGIAFDGAGLGPDNTIWGGEFLIADRRGFERHAHLQYAAMPGGDAASREPWRMALSYMLQYSGPEETEAMLKGFYERLDRQKVNGVLKMLRGGVNCPLTSSAGRLFDAVASITGLADASTFEAEAAIRLEAEASLCAATPLEPYDFCIASGRPALIDLRGIIRGVIRDHLSGAAASVIAKRFHLTLAEVCLEVSVTLRDIFKINYVALSGGVFQNRILLEAASERLAKNGFAVLTNRLVPANDGGISLGQAIVACERFLREKQQGEG